MLVNRFADFFFDKVGDIRLDLIDVEKTDPASANDAVETDVLLSSFIFNTEGDVMKLFKQFATKLCPLDPIPTWLLK